MKLTDRMNQLNSFQIPYQVNSLINIDFFGPILYSFEEGGVELITLPKSNEYPGEQKADKTDGIYKVLVAEIGETEAQKIFDGAKIGTIVTETHIIFDFVGKMRYSFDLPSRNYLCSPVHAVQSTSYSQRNRSQNYSS